MDREINANDGPEEIDVTIRLRVAGTYVPIIETPEGSVLVSDANRFGRATGSLPGVTVDLIDGSSILATKVTESTGLADFSDTGLDLTKPYDIRIQRDSLLRTYSQLVPQGLADATLVLPSTLVGTLGRELVALDTTHTLVLAYDTDPARQLVSDWTSPFVPDGFGARAPEPPAVHVERDSALARLLIASEGLAEVYRANETLTGETASVTVDTFMGLLAFRKTLQEVQAPPGPASPTVSLAEQLAYKATTTLLGISEAAFVESAKAVLPEWAAKLFIKTEQVTAEVLTAGFTSPEWNQPAAKKAFMGQLFGIGTKLAGRGVLASGHVAVTQGDLDVAVAQASQLAGSGTPIEAFQSSQAHVSATTSSIDATRNVSELLSGTISGWSTAADVAILVGTVPALQLAAAIGGALKTFNTGALVTVTVLDLYEHYDVAFEDAPLVAARAFDPSATASVVFVEPMPTPARRQADAVRQRTTDAYLARINALVARIQAGDRDGAIAEAEVLLADDDALQAALAADRLRLLALAEAALARDDDGGGTANRQARGPFQDAFASSITATTGLTGEQMGFYAALAGYIEPALTLPPAGSSAPPFAATDSLLASAPRLISAVTSASSTLDTALELTNGLEAAAYVLVPEHGLPDPAGQAGWTVPDQTLPFQARIVNAGDVAAEGVEVRLVIDGDTTAGDPALHVIGDLTQTVGALAPGEAKTLTWTVATRDTSSTASGSVATYELVTSASSGRVRGAAGGVEVTSAAPVSDEAPVELVAEANLRVYPNPTRGATSLAFDLPTPARARLSMYDALGREVAVMLDEKRPAGTHIVELAPGGLAPGVYVVRLATGDAITTQTLAVVR